MKTHNIGKKKSIFNHFISEIRDVNIQADPMRFRRNIERIGEVFAYEISQHMEYDKQDITTPLGISVENLTTETPVLATILRAGLPLHQGFLNYFDRSDNSFISAYRKHKKGGEFEVKIEYMSEAALFTAQSFQIQLRNLTCSRIQLRTLTILIIPDHF